MCLCEVGQQLRSIKLDRLLLLCVTAVGGVSGSRSVEGVREHLFLCLGHLLSLPLADPLARGSPTTSRESPFPSVRIFRKVSFKSHFPSQSQRFRPILS